MTAPISSAEPLDWPAPSTPVLLHRKVNPAADPTMLSVFADEQWNLTPGLFEAHAAPTRLNFQPVPPSFRDAVKNYIWHVINHTAADRRRQAQSRPSSR